MYPSDLQDPNAPIRQTDTDASLARLSAVRKGYLVDPFVRHFVPRPQFQPPRPPLINIGTYVRSSGIDELVNGWLDRCISVGKAGQIVSLGAGSDTRFWRLTMDPRNEGLARYIEMDFPEITTKKAMAIRKNAELSAVLGSDTMIAGGGTILQSPRYYLLPVDLRLPPAMMMGAMLDSNNSPAVLDPNKPTLLIFECVLAYMTPLASQANIQWFADYFNGRAPLGGIIYEMFGLGDPFGRVMLTNLKTRNVDLPGVEPYPDIPSLPSRFLRHDFTAARALTLRDVRRNYISSAELERITNIEMLDEVEELELVLQHYAITWGVRLPGNTSPDQDWASWGMKEKQ